VGGSTGSGSDSDGESGGGVLPSEPHVATAALEATIHSLEEVLVDIKAALDAGTAQTSALEATMHSIAEVLVNSKAALAPGTTQNTVLPPAQPPPPPQAQLPNATPAAATNQASLGAHPEFDTLRPSLAANPPADQVTCATAAALDAYRDHTGDVAGWLPTNWVATAIASVAKNNKCGQMMNNAVALAREVPGDGVCLGPLNSGKCRWGNVRGVPGRGSVYLFNPAGLAARADVLTKYTSKELLASQRK